MGKRPWPITQLEPYIHEQAIPVKEVSITHNKRKMYPPTIVVDANGKPFEALVESTNENTVIVKISCTRVFRVYIY